VDLVEEATASGAAQLAALIAALVRKRRASNSVMR